MFNSYIKSLGEIICHHHLIIIGEGLLIGDDVQMYFPAPGILSDADDILSWCLEAVEPHSFLSEASPNPYVLPESLQNMGCVFFS